MLLLLDGLAGALAIIAAVSDIRSYRIPNWVSVALIGLFALRAMIEPAGVVGSLTIGAFMLAVGFVMFATRLFGAGDAKLLAALSLWAGPALILEFLTATALSGGIVATVILFCRKAVVPSAAMSSPNAGVTASGAAMHGAGVKRVSSPMPYGVAIAAGGLWCLARHFVGS